MNCLGALLVGSALPLVAADITGTWKLEAEIGSAHVSRVCTIKQAENKLRGICRNRATDVALTGDVDGNSVTWRYGADYEGQRFTLVYKGTLESETEIRGSITSEVGSGTFTARKQ